MLHKKPQRKRLVGSFSLIELDFVYYIRSLTVRLLETRTSTASTVFLRLTSTRISNKKITVIVQQSLSQLVLGALINVLSMVSYDSLSNSSTDSVDLSGDSSSLDADTDIEVSEFFLSKDEDGLEGLQTEGFGLDELDGLTVDLDESTSLLCESASGGGLFPEEGKRWKYGQWSCKIDTHGN